MKCLVGVFFLKWRGIELGLKCELVGDLIEGTSGLTDKQSRFSMYGPFKSSRLAMISKTKIGKTDYLVYFCCFAWEGYKPSRRRMFYASNIISSHLLFSLSLFLSSYLRGPMHEMRFFFILFLRPLCAMLYSGSL